MLRTPKGFTKKKSLLRDNHFACLFFFFSLPPSYALPTKSTEVMVMPEQGTKMYVDVVLRTHERVVQVNVKTCDFFFDLK